MFQLGHRWYDQEDGEEDEDEDDMENDDELGPDADRGESHERSMSVRKKLIMSTPRGLYRTILPRTEEVWRSRVREFELGSTQLRRLGVVTVRRTMYITVTTTGDIHSDLNGTATRRWDEPCVCVCVCYRWYGMADS